MSNVRFVNDENQEKNKMREKRRTQKIQMEW